MSTKFNAPEPIASPAAWKALRAIFGVSQEFEPVGTVRLFLPGLTVAEWLKRIEAALDAAKE